MCWNNGHREWLAENEVDTEILTDDEDVRLVFALEWLGGLGYNVERLRVDRLYARNATAREWLRGQGWNPDGIFLPDRELPKREWTEYDEQAIKACVSEWYAHMIDQHGDELPAEFELDPRKADWNQLILNSVEITRLLGHALPILGKELLLDGRTGDAFDQACDGGHNSYAETTPFDQKIKHMRVQLGLTRW